MEINEMPLFVGASTKELHAQVWEYTLTRRRVIGNCDISQLSNPEDAAAFFHRLGLHDYEQEHLIAVMLDTKQRIKGYTTVCIGLVDRSPMHAREVFRNAILMGASRVLLCHNHPSGDPAPSQADIASTKQLVEAGNVVGIEIVDHIIIAAPGTVAKSYASLRELGFI